MSDQYLAPHWERAALATIDVQNDFAVTGAPMEVLGTAERLPQMAALAAAFRRARRPIVHVVRLYLPDGSNVDLCRRAAVERGDLRVGVPGTPGANPVAALLPAGAPPLDADLLLAGGFQPLGPSEWAMYKPRWGAFYDTGLETFLRQRGVDTLVFAGCNFPNCPRTSIYEATERDFRVVAAVDAISGVYDRGFEELSNIGVVMLDVAEIVRTLARSTETLAR